MEELTVTIHDLARGGAGVSRLESGEIVFVPFTAPGDRVKIRILKKTKSYSHGILIEILERSVNRVDPKCPSFTKCGGCSWQHLPYALQFETKKKGLIQSLKRAGIGAETLPIDEFPAEQTYHYRNRIQLKGNPKTREIGFFEKGSKILVPIQTCTITDERINGQIQRLAEEGFSRFKDPFKLEIDLSPSGEVRSAWEQKNAANGFQQVNDLQNLKLQSWVAKHIKSSENLFDLYGGNGNLSLSLTAQFKLVTCIDHSQPGAEVVVKPKNYHFDRKDVQKWASIPFEKTVVGQGASFILDPPREGIGSLFPILEKKISKTKVQSLILVGCDVDSFTRDVSNFLRAGYRIERLGALDLFPQTPHLESLALFSK